MILLLDWQDHLNFEKYTVTYYRGDDGGFLGALGLPESECNLSNMIDVRNFSKCTIVDDAEQIC